MQDLILEMVITAVVLPLLGWAVKALTSFLNSKIALVYNEILQNTLADATDELDNAVSLAVAEVGATFVKEIKKDGVFSKEDATKAYEMAVTRTMEIMSESGMQALANAKINISAYIKSLIESNVEANK